ncbi:MAG: hypothetical protein ACRDSZ_06965 [Pseudonocardiaceae bacterium]
MEPLHRLATIYDFDQITAARVPKQGEVDLFAPEVVVWAYEGPPQWALRALLNLVHPAHPDAPTSTFPAPRALHIPRAKQRPMTIKLPSSDQAGVRAARLATTMQTEGGCPGVGVLSPVQDQGSACNMQRRVGPEVDRGLR